MALLPRLRRFAYGLAGSRAAADDLVQDAYERAIRHIDGFERGTRLDHWMFQIVRNVHLNKARADRVRRDHAAQAAPEVAHDGERAAEARFTLDAVRRFVWRLPEEQRAALMLICVEGLSYKEASDQLGVPSGTIASRVARARLALAEMIDGSADAGSSTASQASNLRRIGTPP